MKTTDIYESGSHQMRHCDPCKLPDALSASDQQMFRYSMIKHLIIESRACWDDPEAIEHIRMKYEERGSLEVFEAAQQCIRCAEGICLLIEGNETSWKVGGAFRVVD